MAKNVITYKEVIFTLYERILSESNRLSSQIASLQTQLQDFPEGKLTHSHNENHYKWYQSDGHQNVYIPKENHQLVEQLATKKYLMLLLDTPEYQKLISPHFTPHN